jgi:hypothetical protein
MNEHDQAAWWDWNGDAASFGRLAYERGLLINGQGATSCEAYKALIQ